MNSHKKIMTTRSSHQFHMLKTSTPIFFNSNQIQSNCNFSPQPLIQKSQTVLIPFNKPSVQSEKKVIRIAKKSKPPAPPKIRLIQQGEEEFMRYNKNISPIPINSDFLNEPYEIAKPKPIHYYQTHQEIYQPHQKIQEAFNREIIKKTNQVMPSNTVIEQLQSQIKSIQENNISIKNDLNLLLNNLTAFFQQIQKLSESDKTKKSTSKKKQSKIRSSSLSDMTIDNIESVPKPKYNGHINRNKFKNISIRQTNKSPLPPRYSRHCSNSIYQRIGLPEEQCLQKEQNKRHSLIVDRTNNVYSNKINQNYNLNRSNNSSNSDDHDHDHVSHNSHSMYRSQVLNEQYLIKNPLIQSHVKVSNQK